MCGLQYAYNARAQLVGERMTNMLQLAAQLVLILGHHKARQPPTCSGDKLDLMVHSKQERNPLVWGWVLRSVRFSTSLARRQGTLVRPRAGQVAAAASDLLTLTRLSGLTSTPAATQQWQQLMLSATSDPSCDSAEAAAAGGSIHAWNWNPCSASLDCC